MSTEEIAEAILGGESSEEIVAEKPKMVDVRFYLDELIKHVDGSGNINVACHYEPLRALREAVIREQYDKFKQVKLDRFIQPKH